MVGEDPSPLFTDKSNEKALSREDEGEVWYVQRETRGLDVEKYQ
jgi:hypothetical protein